MTLALKVESLDDVDESLHTLYKEDEKTGNFVLDVDGDDGGGRKKVDEFRNTNRKLMTERDKLKKKLAAFGDVDPESVQEMLEAQKKLDGMEDADLLKAGDVDKVVEKRIGKVKNELTKAIKAKDDSIVLLTKERDGFKNQVHQHTMSTVVTGAVTKVGKVRDGAMSDIHNRARSVFNLNEDGSLVASEGAVDRQGDPLTPETWAVKLVDEAPFLFEPAGGGGGDGGGKKKSGGLGGTIDNTSEELSKNLDEVASGKVQVRQTL